MINNKRGMSLISVLLAAIIIAILAKLMIAPYQKQAAQTKNNQPGQVQHIQNRYQAKQTVDNVRATLKQAEKASAQRARAFENGNF